MKTLLANNLFDRCLMGTYLTAEQIFPHTLGTTG